MKKNSLDIYWENKLDFKYEEEILRYKMLCNDKISKKLVKKYNINPKYNTFSDWEKYIKEKILRISNEELKEYQKYINLKRINEDSISGTLNNFLIPFLIAVVGQLVVEDLPKVYLQMINDFTYNDLYEWSERCFPNLMFTEDSFIHAEQIGSFQDNKLDIINALETLDELMDEERKQYSEQELLEVLQAKSGVTCSGKGSNESGTFKKKILLKDEKNREFHTEISCIPHFKIEKKHSDKRLHFSWGKEEIRKNAIIVVHVGQHWSSENEKEALIKNYIHHA